MKAIKNVFEFQRKVLTIQPNIYVGSADWLYCFVFCFINVPVALVVCSIIILFKMYQDKDSIFHKTSKKFEVLNLYISGYIIFTIPMLTLLIISLGIGLPLRLLTTGNLDGVLSEMGMLSLKDILEMIFCICLYQFSVFYMLCTKKIKSITVLGKQKEFLALLLCCGIVFFFSRVWILENALGMQMMYIFLCISVFILPVLSCIFVHKRIV